MIKSKISLAIAIIFLAQISCYAPLQEYLVVTPIPIEVQIPALVRRNQEFSILIRTEPGVTCYAGISYWNESSKWIGKELPTITANQEGICQWDWDIPEEAKDGAGELRGYVEKEDQSTNLIPKTFCIEVCP